MRIIIVIGRIILTSKLSNICLRKMITIIVLMLDAIFIGKKYIVNLIQGNWISPYSNTLEKGL